VTRTPSLREWLATRDLQPPAALRERLQRALGTTADTPLDEAPERLLDAAEGIVASLIAGNATTRESALDLLVADALVTYAFEAGADDVGRLVERAERATERIARLGAALPVTATHG